VRSGVLKRVDKVKRGRGRPKLTWDESVKRDLKDWNLSILKPRRGPGQGDGPRRPENIGRRIAIRRSEIDRDVNFAKKIPNFV